MKYAAKCVSKKYLSSKKSNGRLVYKIYDIVETPLRN